MYWTNAKRPTATIERSNLDGTDREVILSSNLFMPSGIVVDQETKRIFWADMGEGIYFSIESADLDGQNRKLLFNGAHQSPYGVAITSDMVYWTDTYNNVLWRMKKEGGKPEEIRKFVEVPRGIAIRHDYSKLKHCSVITEAMLIETDSIEQIDSAKDSVECLNGEQTLHGCVCHRGFTGLRCEIDLCHNFCLIGNCYHSRDGYAKCKCPPGFSGDRCEINVCEGHCMNGGKCQPKLENDSWVATCSCRENFSGNRCERIDDVEILCKMICKEGHVQILNDVSISKVCRYYFY